MLVIKNVLLVVSIKHGKNYDFSFIDEYGEQVKGTQDLTKLVPQKYDFQNMKKESTRFRLPYRKQKEY